MPSPRILIVRTSALGDIVHALPVLTALRRHYRSATIGWVVEEAFAPLLRDHPLLDTLLVVRLRPWRKRPLAPSTIHEVTSFISRLQDFSTEVVLDLMGNHKAGVISALTLCDRRLGHTRRFRREPSSSIWISEEIVARGEHAVDRMLSITGGLGIPPGQVDFAPQLLPEESMPGVDTSEPFLLLHPCTGWPNKDYPLPKWAETAKKLAAEGLRVVIVPGPGEQGAARRLEALVPASVDCVVVPTLRQLVFLQRRAALVIGGDTGTIHLAHALGTPVVSVMGPTDPDRNGPYRARGRAVWRRLPCSFCGKKLDGARACLLDIEPQSVVEAVLAYL